MLSCFIVIDPSIVTAENHKFKAQATKGSRMMFLNTSFPVAVSVGENDNVMIFAPLNTIIFRILQRLNIVNMA